ncbi:hypothetical protein V8C86DRAFT_3087522 [Haematococcus lacustris]
MWDGPTALVGGKRLCKKKRQQKRQQFKRNPNSLKAQMIKAQDEAMQLRAQVERLHQQLSDAVADLQHVREVMEQLQAAKHELQEKNVSLEQQLEERTHALQLLQRDQRRLSHELCNIRCCRSSGPRLTRHQ